MKIDDIKKIRWSLFSGNPILRGPKFSPLIADPSLLLSSESPDGKYYLFCHTLFGIHRYESRDGIHWDKGLLLFRHAMRPYIYKENDIFYLLYERYTAFQIVFSWFPFWKWDSRIEIRTSNDLKIWSEPKTILKPAFDWHQDPRYGKSVGNPCLIKIEDRYRLYYSASLSWIPDCGFCEPTHIGIAEADEIFGPYRSFPNPILSPDSSFRNLASGALKVLKVEDGFIGFENCIYQDAKGSSGSAIFLLFSSDGLEWNFLSSNPILAPSTGWMRSHVYALDVKFDPGPNRWLLYFNARNDWHWTKGEERIGLMYGDL